MTDLETSNVVHILIVFIDQKDNYLYVFFSEQNLQELT